MNKQMSMSFFTDEPAEVKTHKTVVVFATSGSSVMGETVEKLKNSCPGAKLLEGKVFKPRTSKTELFA